MSALVFLIAQVIEHKHFSISLIICVNFLNKISNIRLNQQEKVLKGKLMKIWKSPYMFVFT